MEKNSYIWLILIVLLPSIIYSGFFVDGVQLQSQQTIADYRQNEFQRPSQLNSQEDSQSSQLNVKAVIRILQNKRQQRDQNDDEGMNTYLVLIVAGACGLCGLTCICCIIFCYRQINQRRGTGGINYGKVANISLNYDFIFPPLNYDIFLKEIGNPNSDQCVICLTQFQTDIHIQLPIQQQPPKPNTVSIQRKLKDKKLNSQLNFFAEDLFVSQHSNQRSKPSQNVNNDNGAKISKRRKLNPIQGRSTDLYVNEIASQVGSVFNGSVIPEHSTIRQNKQETMIKYTTCGHLLHSKCLSDWLSRQSNCPLCREPFDETSILRWQQLLEIDLQQEYSKIKRNPKPSKKHKEKKKESQFQQTIQQLQRSYPRNNELQQELPKKLQHKKYTNLEQYAIVLYRKILQYHEKNKNYSKNLIFDDQIDEEYLENYDNGQFTSQVLNLQKSGQNCISLIQNQHLRYSNNNLPKIQTLNLQNLNAPRQTQQQKTPKNLRKRTKIKKLANICNTSKQVKQSKRQHQQNDN